MPLNNSGLKRTLSLMATFALAISSVVAIGGSANADAALTSTVYSFETGDAAGALLAGASANDKLQGGFEGAETSIADAPAGGNGGKALKIQKKTGGQPYAGVNMVKFAVTDRITDATHKLVTFNYYSPKANSPVRLELTPWPVALGVVVNAAQGWQTLTFDLSTATGNAGAVWSATTEYQSMALFPDFNNAPDDAVYYVDNFAFNGGTTPAIVVARAATSTLLTFEANDALGAGIVGASEGAKLQGAFAGAETTIADAPAGGNGGKALKIVKKADAQVYAGVNIVNFAANTKIGDATHKILTFNYYSPKANSPTRVEIVPYPHAFGTTFNAALGWQTLSFDLSAMTGDSTWSADREYTALSFFPDFNVAGDNAVYYIDNLAFNGATTPAIPVVTTTVAPAMTKAATVSGTANVGKSLTVAKGTWTGTPAPTYAYSWYRCTVTGKATTAAPTSSAKCSAISKATA